MSAIEANSTTSGDISIRTPAAASAAAARIPFYRKLYVQVLIAVALGYLYPEFSVSLKPYGDAFVRAINVVVAPIIFTTIVMGIARMGDIRRLLFIALLLGMALSLAGSRGRPMVAFLESASVALFDMVRIIIVFAPIAALCAMAFTVGKYGLKTLLDLGQLAGFIETDETRAWNAPHEPQMQGAG